MKPQNTIKYVIIIPEYPIDGNRWVEIQSISIDKIR